MGRVFNELERGAFDRQGKRVDPLPKGVFLPVLLLSLTCLCNGLPKCEAAKAVSIQAQDAAQTYRDFLSNPPWLKDIKFRLDRNYRVDVTDERHPRREEGMGEYEAALQPEGYYRKHLAGSPIYDNPPGQTPASRPVVAGQETISGTSDRFYWRLWEGQDQISLVPKEGQSGAAPNNWLRGFFNFEMADLEKIRRLGLDHLVDARITWVDKDHFTAVSSSRGPAHGAIIQHTNGLPDTVAYSFDSASSLVYRVHYAYAPGVSFPPHQISVEDTDAAGDQIIHVNYIDELEVGLDPNAKTGYHPEAFRTQTAPFAHVSLSSNGVLYQVSQHGQLNPVDTRYPGLEQFTPLKPHPLIVGLVMITPTLALVLYFVMNQRRMKRQDNFNVNQTNQ